MILWFASLLKTCEAFFDCLICIFLNTLNISYLIIFAWYPLDWSHIKSDLLITGMTNTLWLHLLISTVREIKIKMDKLLCNRFTCLRQTLMQNLQNPSHPTHWEEKENSINWAAIQWDLHRLQRWVERNPRRRSKPTWMHSCVTFSSSPCLWRGLDSVISRGPSQLLTILWFSLSICSVYHSNCSKCEFKVTP